MFVKTLVTRDFDVFHILERRFSTYLSVSSFLHQYISRNLILRKLITVILLKFIVRDCEQF